DMLSRLETMVLMGMELPIQAIRQQIASGIDILIHLGRMKDKSRKVLEIAEIIGIEKGEIVLNVLFRYEDGLKKVGELKHREKLDLFYVKDTNGL
ncbi:MAG: CpaF family protein, partial [Lachnospiraceae bacterium]|nr:CpaF family protein [Lachnospiraceae bacterium]